MKLDSDQIASKKQVGMIDGHPIYQLRTTGGLVLIAFSKSGKLEILGAASHPAIAQWLAEKKEPNASWTTLAKSEQADYGDFAHLVPAYEALTEAMRARAK